MRTGQAAERSAPGRDKPTADLPESLTTLQNISLSDSDSPLVFTLLAEPRYNTHWKTFLLLYASILYKTIVLESSMYKLCQFRSKTEDFEILIDD